VCDSLTGGGGSCCSGSGVASAPIICVEGGACP
jgi:hypothetical protein